MFGVQLPLNLSPDCHSPAFFFVSRGHAVQVTVTVCDGPPSPRANFTVTSLPTGDMILFGGECFDGQDTKCFNELFRCVVYAVLQTCEIRNTVQKMHQY